MMCKEARNKKSMTAKEAEFMILITEEKDRLRNRRR
jgi:hypothetical protein